MKECTTAHSQNVKVCLDSSEIEPYRPLQFGQLFGWPVSIFQYQTINLQIWNYMNLGQVINYINGLDEMPNLFACVLMQVFGKILTINECYAALV